MKLHFDFLASLRKTVTTSSHNHDAGGSLVQNSRIIWIDISTRIFLKLYVPSKSHILRLRHAVIHPLSPHLEAIHHIKNLQILPILTLTLLHFRRLVESLIIHWIQSLDILSRYQKTMMSNYPVQILLILNYLLNHSSLILTRKLSKIVWMLQHQIFRMTSVILLILLKLLWLHFLNFHPVFE